jgi:hypothetical protein
MTSMITLSAASVGGCEEPANCTETASCESTRDPSDHSISHEAGRSAREIEAGSGSGGVEAAPSPVRDASNPESSEASLPRLDASTSTSGTEPAPESADLSGTGPMGESVRDGGNAEVREPLDGGDVDASSACAVCSPPLSICRDLGDAQACVECTAHEHCTEALPACENDTCAPCSPVDDFGCGADLPRCLLGASASLNSCVRCIDGSDCPTATPVCDDYQCIRCATADHAGCTDEAPLCLAGSTPSDNSCVECFEDDDCQGGELTSCFENACSACAVDEDCTSANAPVCVRGSCTECSTDANCSRFPTLKGCNADLGECVSCTKDGHCTAAGTSHCDGDGCVPCTLDTHCVHIADRPFCNDGVCEALNE